MRGPLALVVTDDTGTERHVTSKTSGLRFKRSAYGGAVDLTASLAVPRRLLGDLGPGSTVRLDDARSCERVFVGDLDNPGATDGPAGQTFDLQAFGGAARLQAAKTALAAVVQDLGDWVRSGNSTKNATTGQDEKGEGNETLEFKAPTSGSVQIAWQGEMIYRPFKQNGLKVGRVRADVDSGLVNTNYLIQLRTGTSDTDLNVRDSSTASTAIHTLRATLDGAIAAGDTAVSLRVVRNGSSITGTKDHWFRFSNVVARQVLKDVFGDNIMTGYTDNTVRAHEVIADMIGRGMAPGADPIKAVIAETEYDIDNLSWLDGITMGDALTALQVLEPDLWWTLYGDEFTSGLWDAEPRYPISKSDGGISLPGQSIAKANRVQVTWTDHKGKDHTDPVTADVVGLSYTQDAEPITLPPGTGSPANAQRAGIKALALHNDPPRAGTAVIRRRIFDRWQGRYVLPHQIMPGCLVVERETGDTFRLTEVDYSDPDAAATLTLGDPVKSIDQFLARLHRKQRRRG